MTTKLPQHWNLDSFFKGGSQSSDFHLFLSYLERSLPYLKQKLHHHDELKEAITFWGVIDERLCHARSFVWCLAAQNVNDTEAIKQESTILEISAQFDNLTDLLGRRLASLSDEEFTAFLDDPDVASIAFPLHEKRLRINEKLSEKQESFLNKLAVDGYHGWSQLYCALIGQVTIPFKEDGNVLQLSWGQAEARLSSPSREVRQVVFQNSNQAWQKNKDLFAQALNHIAGFRLKAYHERAWKSPLKEPLDICRMQLGTVELMWKVIEKNKIVFLEYMKRKASLLKIDQLSWYDIQAPLTSKKADPFIPYEKAAAFIIKEFGSVSPKMEEFARNALENGWVECEDRTGKMPGGFCTGFPLSRESRIFMTYAGTKENMITLAHELGHGFHEDVIYRLPPMVRHYPMNLAETASTLAEMIVIDGAIRQESDPYERLCLLETKIQRSVLFAMNIHARFIFEMAFYEEREKGSVIPEKLCTMMEDAQRKAYLDALKEYHPYFWASKGHFYNTEVPFYNFPYTFGYFFSLGIYAKLQQAPDFEERYVGLLADTGRQTTEVIASKHLGEDLTQPHFWQKALDLAAKDVEQFLELSKRFI